MIETLKLIADQYGTNILKDGSKLLAYYSDIAPQQKAERQMLEYLLKCDGNIKLMDTSHESHCEQQACADMIVKQMTSQLFISEDAAYTVCDNFLQAIGCEPIQRPTTAISVQPVILDNPLSDHKNTSKEGNDNSHLRETRVTHSSSNSIAWKFITSKPALICAVLAIVIIIVCVIASLPTPPEPDTQSTNESPQQTQVQNNTVNQQKDDEISKVYAQALRLKENKDYSAAIEYINSNLDTVGNNKEIMSVLSACENSYRQDVVSAAMAAYKSAGYEAALAEIDAGLAILPDDTTLLSEQAAYNECKPISLFSLTPYTYSETKPAHYKNMKDTLGNNYADAWQGFGKESDGGSSVTYDIGKRYNTLTGTIIVREDDKGEPDAASIRIYGDGVLLYEKTNITSDTKPIPIQLDVTNVTDLKIELNCGGGNWMSGYHVYAVICDVQLEKMR